MQKNLPALQKERLPCRECVSAMVKGVPTIEECKLEFQLWMISALALDWTGVCLEGKGFLKFLLLGN